MKISRKVFIGLGILLALIIVLGGALFFRTWLMAKHIQSIEIEDVDLSKIDDGVYPGVFADFLVAIKLNVTVKEHQITNIEIIEQRSGPGYEALETVDRILEAQSPKVEAVTGATGSSRTIMIAVQNALRGGQNQ
ncbi:MAG: FMN-binding protein [candidate division WOR-3 bacterium]|nr:MAG: FMN-binding protein [candidate division WOR-3 bacterium]